LVETLALDKAKLIAKKHPNSLILAADTIVVKNEKIIGKPKDQEHARKMLIELSGKTHFVFTGLALIDARTGRTLVKSVKSAVTFNKLSEEQIQNYLKTKEWLGKAGSYSSQEQGGKILIKQIEGDPTNVVGLPKTTFLEMLDDLNLEITI
jgi:septum formation protein